MRGLAMGQLPRHGHQAKGRQQAQQVVRCDSHRLPRARDDAVGMRESTRAVERCRAATSARKRKGLLRARDGATATGARKRQAIASYRTG